MKAAVLDKFGSVEVMQVRDVPKPAIGPGQILAEVYATNINPIDWKMREGQMAARYGDDFPMILGFDCSGVVAEVGEDVTDFKVGDEILARSDVGTGRCYAEFAELNPRTVVHKPKGLSLLDPEVHTVYCLYPPDDFLKKSTVYGEMFFQILYL